MIHAVHKSLDTSYEHRTEAHLRLHTKMTKAHRTEACTWNTRAKSFISLSTTKERKCNASFDAMMQMSLRYVSH